MKIVQVTPAFPPSALGGVSHHAELISGGLVSRGHTVRVATTNRYDFRQVMSFWGFKNRNGLQIYYAKAHWPGQYFFAPDIAKVLSAWIPRAEIVHIHLTRTFVGVVAQAIARNAGVPYVLTCHGSLNPKVGNTTLKMLHDVLVGRGLAENAARIIAVSEKERDGIVKLGIERSRVVVVPNAVPPSANYEQSQPAERPSPSYQGRRVLYLGRVHGLKGIDRLIRAFALLGSDSTGVELAIAGQDFGAVRKLAKEAEKLGISNQVRFLGPAFGEEKQALLRNSGVLVLPSRYEVFGLVILEGLAAGIPLVVTRECGMSEELDAAGAALVVSSTEEMARAMRLCLEDQDLRIRLRTNGFRFLNSQYNWNEALDRLIAVYSEIAANRV